MTWTINDIGDLSNKVVVITGANSGLGYETTKLFLEHGAEVVMACRSIERGNKALDSILSDLEEHNVYIKNNVELMELDLSDLDSVNQFVSNFKDNYNKLDILMNNAGIMATPYGLTKDGFESQFGTNHLGHFALTAGLFDVIKATPNARIVNISSMAHKAGTMDFYNLQFKDGEGYTPFKAYSRSKLANLMFTYEMQRRINASVYDVKVLAAHPGGANTNLASHMESSKWGDKLEWIMTKVIQSAYDGALPGVRAATDEHALGGEYYGPSGFMETKGNPVIVSSNNLSHSKIKARRLWKVSEKLVNIEFDI